jgi:hypothetical protein
MPRNHFRVVVQVMVRVIDLPLPAQVVLQVSFQPDNRSVLVLSDDGAVVLLTAVDSECKAALEMSSTERVLGTRLCTCLGVYVLACFFFFAER